MPLENKLGKARQESRFRRVLFAVLLLPAGFLSLAMYNIGLDEEQSFPVSQTSHCPKIDCATTKGHFTIVLRPDLAPNGTKFLQSLVQARYFHQHIPFFRVNDVITQFGITKRVPREEDPFVQFRKGADRDANPYGGIANDRDSIEWRKRNAWKRGTMASIGGFHFVVVIRANRHMGINRHDAPLGFISEDDMRRVFDRLYKYNDIVDHPHGPPGVDQGRLMGEGLEYIKKEFPLTDLILDCKCVR